MAFKDARQGAASIVFLVVFATLTAINIYGLVTRRPKRRFAGSTIFTSIRVGAMIAGIGWSVVLYDNFGWLIASLVLGAEGYFALVFAIFLHMFAYEIQNFGRSWMAPKAPPGVNKFWFRIRTPGFVLEQVLVAANVLVVVGGSKISSGLSTAHANSNDSNFEDIPNVKTGQHIRTAGQVLFLATIVSAYIVLGMIMRKAKGLGKDVSVLWWIAATAPFMLARGAFGVFSTASFSWSYYNPANYGPDGLLNRQLIAEYVLGSTTEAITAMILMKVCFTMTVPKMEYVGSKRQGVDDPESPTGRNEIEGVEPLGREDAEMNDGGDERDHNTHKKNVV